METSEIQPRSSTTEAPHHVLAALAAGAAAIHFAMAPAHSDEATLVGLGFVVAAWFQAVLASVLVVRPSRRWLGVGAAANVAVLAVWLLSRTTGVPFLHGGEPEAAALIDLTSAAFEGAFVVGAVAALAGYRSSVSRVLGPAGVVAVIATVGLTMTALALPTEEHGHEHGTGAIDVDGVAAAGHEHTEVEAVEPHDHAEAEAAVPASGAHHHADCSEPVTSEQQRAADEFIAASNATVAKYADPAVAESEGWQPITPPGGALVHFGKLDRMADGHQLDPRYPESLLYAYGPDRTPYFVGAMYLSETSGAEDLPQPGGCLMTWHNHENLCIAPGQGMVGVVGPDGGCPGGSENVATSYMLHAWTIPMPDGPFSEIDARAVRQAVVDTYLS